MKEFQAAYHFPKGFLWGCATAPQQVEGRNTNNNWSFWENQPGRILHGEKAGLACDWWGGRWKEDFDRAAETHQNSQRIGVEWSRIQPTPDRWDEEALDIYRDMVRGLNDRGMSAMVTLHHFSDPLWLMERGGWESGDTPRLFERFTEKVVGALKEYVQLWITINEPNVYAYSGYLVGGFPPGKKDIGLTTKVMANMLKGHALAYHAIHRIQPEARVGVAHHYRSFQPAGWSPLNKLVSSIQHKSFNDSFAAGARSGIFRFLFSQINVPVAKNTQDFMGVNYYTRDQVHFDLRHPMNAFANNTYREGVLKSGTGYLALEPDGLREALKWAVGYQIPIIVTENGAEDAEDHFRPRYLLEHIHQVWRAVNFNWQVKGYYHWSLIDNFEWERGWSQRFGLWGLDIKNQKRYRRTSVDLYSEICRENGITTDMVRKYAPESLGIIFPS
jgi:beta-glucosidase